MKARRTGTLIHIGLLAASVIAAAGMWTREKEPKALAAGDVLVWSGHAPDVDRVGYESKTRKVSVEAKKDALGRYFVGTLEREGVAIPSHDGGAPQPSPKVVLSFVSVGPGDKLAEALAPLKAIRALGKIGADRAAEFGLAEPEATVTVHAGGADHTLLLGSATPGGGDRYARDSATSEVYVLKGEPLRNLESADTLLIEHDLHAWKDSEATRVRIEAGGKARDLVRGGPENKRFWADAGSPDTNDETVGNWMSKLDRLRPTEFALTEPEGKEVLLKVTYTGDKAPGYVEVVKVKGDKPTFYLRTERTRLYGKVVSAPAEQLEQDLAAIVK
jgi:hypothetical protein